MEPVSAVLPFAMLILLAVAAWRDVMTRTIPDSVSLLLLVAGLLARVLQGPLALVVSIAIALLVFALLLLAHARGLIGGGDIKVMTALAFGLSPLDCYRFVMATALAGGLLGVCYLLMSRCLRSPSRSAGRSFLCRIAAIEAWRIRRRGPLPYGVAIAAGGAFVLLNSGSL